jgi:hypothetical protein
MSEFSTVSKVAIGASLAIAAAGAAYVLFRKEEVVAEAAASSREPEIAEIPAEKLDASKITVEQLLSIMDKIIESQNVMKGVMKRISDEITSSDMKFVQAYERVRELQPNDPMEQTGLTMNEFDQLLDKYQEDPRILDSIARIMGPSEEDMAMDDGKVLSVKELIDIHQYMLDELRSITEEVKTGSTKSVTSIFDPRTLTVTAQVLVGAKVEKKFKVGSPAVERSVMEHQAQLATDHKFATINMMMQQTMTELMGEQNMLAGRE